MASQKSTITRPYTSYNLFFQLEREYILQTLHGYRPTIDPANEFDPNNESIYSGPPLPSRYANLTLPYDWHIPGKTRRRKRSHRKSHGKIGFHELNEQISKSWAALDSETRKFCVTLSDVEGKKYKKIKKMMDKVERKKNKSTKKISSKSAKKNDDSKNSTIASFDWTPNTPLQGEFKSVGPRQLFPKMDRTVSRESIYNEQGCDIQDSTSTEDSTSFRDSLTEIDMEDDEIMELWNTTSIEEDDTIHPVCRVCTETPEQYPPYFQEEQEKKVDDKRTSYIDEEYERFKEIGKHFKTRNCIPMEKLELNTFIARQA